MSEHVHDLHEDSYGVWCARCPMRWLRLGGRPDALRKERDAALSALAESQKRVEVLREALRFQDPRNATERYDRIANDFERETGIPAPGRSRPPEMGGGLFLLDEEGMHKAWRAFVNAWHERWFDAVLSGDKP